MFKCYTPDIFKFDDKTENEIYVRSPLQPYLRTYQHAGAVSFLFILIWSKSFIIIFLFKCKLLINAFVIFNQRVYTTIIKGKSHHAKRGLISVHVLFKVSLTLYTLFLLPKIIPFYEFLHTCRITAACWTYLRALIICFQAFLNLSLDFM